MSDGFVESLISSGEDGAALTNTTTPTSIIPYSRKIVLPGAVYWDRVNKRLRGFASGRISTFSAPGTLTLDLRLGSAIVFNGGASPTLVASQTNLTWRLDFDLQLRGIGATATLLGTAELKTLALTGGLMLMPASAPAVGATFDSTAALTLDLFATWSVASASNSIQNHQFTLETGT